MPSPNGSNPFATDRTPKISIQVDDEEYSKLTEYAYDNDILQLGDSFSLVMPNVAGEFNSKPALGALVQFFMADPAVEGGKKIIRLTGRIIKRDIESTNAKGTTLRVTGSDLGWHLSNTCGELWTNFKNLTFQQLLDKSLDASWKFAGIRNGNDLNKRLNQGRAVLRSRDSQVAVPIPPIQYEPGENISDVLIRYARREKFLINVSSDGYLQIFKPNYIQQSAYAFHNHFADAQRHLNNVKTAHLSDAIDGIYTKVICVGDRIQEAVAQTDGFNPNNAKWRATHINGFGVAQLPFNRLLTMTDQDPLNSKQGKGRAEWKAQRGMFDSWTLTYLVPGHSQDGRFFVPDTMCEVQDDVLGVQGSYYISACHYSRTMDRGTETLITIKKPSLLSA